MKLQFKLQPVLIALTIANFSLLAFLLSQTVAVAAPAPGDGVLRGKGLEIVDAKGKVRASITLFPAEKLNDGSTYPETVLLRLITPDGRPSVKLAAMTTGSGFSFTDGKGLSYVQLIAEHDDPKINIVDKTGAKVKSLP